MDKKTEEFYDRLKVELDLNNTWPEEYLFKFIVPSDATNIEKVQTVSFDCIAIKTKNQNGQFTSISIDVTMKNAQEIVDKYLEVSTIEGISL
jgi:vacuolar-type H+-ATPase subunit D/Vma8